MSTPLLEVRNLKVAFPPGGGPFRRSGGEVHAVDDVSFTVHAGETLGLVGESGCGKTTVAKAVTHLLRFTVPDVRVSGQILYHADQGPVNLLALSKAEMRPYRALVQIIFQDPYSSLNPRLTIRQIVGAPLRIHTRLTGKAQAIEVSRLLERVGLQPADADRYPHEFSGGQRQRIGIARALAVRPRLIVADEPVSALDVSVQAQVINLLQDLQEEFGLAYLFVAHDLSVVYHISRRIAVMYLGRLVEIGEAEAVYCRPGHPYTQALLSAIPRVEPAAERSERVRLRGEVPTPLNRPGGCVFHPRCPIARPECSTAIPLLETRAGGQQVACPYTKDE